MARTAMPILKVRRTGVSFSFSAAHAEMEFGPVWIDLLIVVRNDSDSPCTLSLHRTAIEEVDLPAKSVTLPAGATRVYGNLPSQYWQEGGYLWLDCNPITNIRIAALTTR